MDVRVLDIPDIPLDSCVHGMDQFHEVCAVGDVAILVPHMSYQPHLLVYDWKTRGVVSVDISEFTDLAMVHPFKAVCAIENKVVLAPYDSSHLVVYDTATEQLKGVEISTIAVGECKFGAICTLGDKVVAAPEDADTLLVYDVRTEDVRGIDISAIATGKGKFAGICAVEGKAVAVPKNASQLLVYDVDGEVKGIDISTVLTTKVDNDGASDISMLPRKFGAVCAIEGKVLACPSDVEQLLVYDVATEEVHGVNISTLVTMMYEEDEDDGSGKFHAMCAVQGKAVAVPYNARQLLVYDVMSGEAKGIPIPSNMLSFEMFHGACAIGGTVVAPPFYTQQMLVYDLTSEKVWGVDLPEVPGRAKWWGICAVADTVVAAPCNVSQILACRVTERLVVTLALRSSRNENVQQEIVCTSCGGDELAFWPFEEDTTITTLCSRLSEQLELPAWRFQFVLPSGALVSQDACLAQEFELFVSR